MKITVDISREVMSYSEEITKVFIRNLILNGVDFCGESLKIITELGLNYRM